MMLVPTNPTTMRVFVFTALLATCLLPTTVLSDSSTIRGASVFSDTTTPAADSVGAGDASYMTSPLRQLLVDEEGFYVYEEEMREQAEDEPHRTLRRNNNNKRCATTENVDYFDILIAIHPRHAPTNCKVADQVLLGHDINRVMWDYGVGEAGKHDDVIFQAVVCPNPITGRHPQKFPIKKQSTSTGIQMRPSSFMYSGIGGCRFCTGDDRDKRFLIADIMPTSRELASAWFENTFKPQLETTLKRAIKNEVVSLHDGCLGGNPTIEVDVIGMTLSELDLSCKGPNGDAQFLKTFNMQDIVLDQAKHSCGKCNQIDFTTGKSRGRDDGVKRDPVKPGDYIKNQYYKKKNGVRIIAFSDTGYTPSDKARIFDTSNPHSDPDLGSPNEHCPGGGPGIGTGGVPGAEGANCHPVGSK